MHIVQLTAENVKRLTAVTINPKGAVTVIGGANGAGKSSVLDSIMYALGGKSFLPRVPLRKGAKNGKVVLKLEGGDAPLTVTRTFTSDGGGAITVTGEKGVKYPSPQALLNDLCGRAAFDPLEFVRMKPREQGDMLRELVGLDFSDMDICRSRRFNERTIVNREQKRLQAQADAAPRHDDASAEEVSVSGLVDELQRRADTNKVNSATRSKLVDAELDLLNSDNQVASLMIEVARLQSSLKDAQSAREDVQVQVNSFIADVAVLVDADVSDVRMRIDNAEADNRKVADNQHAAQLDKETAEKACEADGLTKTITEMDDDKAKQLAAADWPVDGLGFDENGVILNGLPFDHASSAEQLKVSVAMGFAANPKLPMLLIRDGSLLDADSLESIARQAHEHGGHLFIERVGDGDECTVVIKDGHVMEAATEPE